MANKAVKKIMRTSSTGSKGFTLIEMIVVMVIISVLATMIVPGMYSGRSSAKLRGSAQQLLVAARHARDFATTRRRKCRLMIDLEKQQYALAFQKDPQRNPSEFVPLQTGLGKVQGLGKGLHFGRVWIEPRKGHNEPPENINYITFEPNGQADAAVLEISNDKQTYTIMIAPYTGYAKLIEGTTDAMPNDRLDLDAGV